MYFNIAYDLSNGTVQYKSLTYEQSSLVKMTGFIHRYFTFMQVGYGIKRQDILQRCLRAVYAAPCR